MQVAFYFAGEITQVLDAIPWVRCASGNVFMTNANVNQNLNLAEPCREASVPHPDKFVESSENSLSVHLDGWQDTNCRTVYFIVEQRWWR